MLAVVGLTGCSEDTDPKYHNPTEFVLNTPALQEQYYELTDGGQFQLTCSQPDYGYSAVANYSAEVSLSADFAQFESLTNTTPTQSIMVFKDSDLAVALCALNGIETEDQKDEYNARPAQRVYFRAVCELDGVEGSRIVSNVVYLDQVKGYFAVPVAGYIYLVGQCEGWATPDASQTEHFAPWRLFEADDAIGSKIYSGVFDIPAGTAMFRFYTALTGWDNDSYGAQVDDNPVEFEFTDGVFEGSIVKGKGSFSFPNWPGGMMTIVVNLKENIVQMFAGEQEVVTPKYLYLVGAPSGWVAPSTNNQSIYDNWTLVDKTDSGIYEGTFSVAAGEWSCIFRIATSLVESATDDWNANYIAASVEDANIAVDCTDYTGSYTSGVGNWYDENWPGGDLHIVVDTNTQTVKFEAV